MTKKLEQTEESRNFGSTIKRDQQGPRVKETGDMGFNPHRKQKKRASDIYIVVFALAVTFALVLWALAA